MMDKKYEDMLYMKRPVSNRYPEISMKDRAGQFAPFAALAGHKESIAETGRTVDKKIELSSERLDKLDIKFHEMIRIIGKNSEIAVTHFISDENKDGGKYITEFLKPIKFSRADGKMTFSGGKEIDIDNIIDIRGEGISENL